MKDIAFDNFVSSNTVARILAKFDNSFNVDFNLLPKHLCFDEFKSTRDAKGAMSFIFCDVYNHKIIIDRFHIVNLFTRSFNHTRINTMKSFSTYSFKYKRLKRYWKCFLKPFRLLDPIHFLKQVHFPDRMVSSVDIVEESIGCNEILKCSYDCYQLIREDIEKRDFDLFKNHLEYFKDRVSDIMKVSIDTCFKYIYLIENSFKYEYSNGVIEGINNFIKALKRISFGFKRFVNFRTRIFITRNLLSR